MARATRAWTPEADGTAAPGGNASSGEAHRGW